MNQASSPNWNARNSAIQLEYIVLHGTGMIDAKSALIRMCDPTAEVSAHYMIDEEGIVTQLVDEKARAWHAGRSFWRKITDMNSASIGIELVNPGHEHGYRGYPLAQITSLKHLLGQIIERNGLNAKGCLLGHSDIAPSRKTDPGELFPWEILASEGLGVWPTPSDYTAGSPGEPGELLAAIGYTIESERDATLAFQRRFYPGSLTGLADIETLARLRATKKLLC